MKNRYHRNRELLSAYFDDMLPEGRKQKVKEHLDSCAECREILQGLEAVRQLLRKYPLKDPGVGFQTAILSRIEKEKKSLVLRAWSRRVSLSLGSLALLLITFLFLYKPYLPSPIIEPEKIVTQPRAGKIEEKKALTPVKPTTPERKYSTAKEKEQKQLPGPTVAASLGRIPGLPAAEKEELRDIASGLVAPSVKAPVSADRLSPEGLTTKEAVPLMREEETRNVKSIKVGGDLTIRGIRVGTPSAPESVMVPSERIGRQEVIVKPFIVKPVSPQNTIVRTNEEWTRLWFIQNAVQNLSLPLPQVDFKNQMVIAVPTRQDNREYRIVKTEDKNDKIVVQYQEIAAGKDKEKSLPLPYQLEIVNSRPVIEFRKTD